MCPTRNALWQILSGVCMTVLLGLLIFIQKITAEIVPCSLKHPIRKPPPQPIKGCKCSKLRKCRWTKAALYCIAGYEKVVMLKSMTTGK